MITMVKKARFVFVKYQACGNDFILKDEEKEKIPDKRKASLVKKLCNRNFGIGADGILYIESSNKADARMRLFDREDEDQEALMCGNGVRCVADYVCRKLKKNKIKIETGDGVKEIIKTGENYTVDMGRLRYTMNEMKKLVNYNFPDDEKLLDKEIKIPNLGIIKVSIVNSGDPHAVIFVDDIDKVDINKYGKTITENKELFPLGINVDMCEIINKNAIKVRTYEAGVYRETLACGTGSTACAAVFCLTEKTKEDKIKVIVRGGELIIEVKKNTMFMTGPAVPVYKGEIEINY